MPQANVWQRCGCPARDNHQPGACPVLAGFEAACKWICMPCLTGCGLAIVPGNPYTYSEYYGGRQRTGFTPVLVVARDALGRAGDSDRDDGFRKLAAAFEKGRIGQDDYERRLDVVGDAAWKSDIAACLSDLT